MFNDRTKAELAEWVFTLHETVTAYGDQNKLLKMQNELILKTNKELELRLAGAKLNTLMETVAVYDEQNKLIKSQNNTLVRNNSELGIRLKDADRKAKYYRTKFRNKGKNKIEN